MAEEKEKKQYKIADIARELGVSKTTVSRALSGKGRIGRDTVERVNALARQYGYQQKKAAGKSFSGKTRNLSLIMPMEDSDMPFFKECMFGICEEAAVYQYDIILSVLKEKDLFQVRQLVANHKVDGFILTRTAMNSRLIEFLKGCGLPFIVIGPSDDPEVPSIDNPNREASRELTGLLLMKGSRRLALIGGNSTHYVTESRKQGFVDAHRDKGILLDDSLVFMEVDNYRKAMQAVEAILYKEADGIVCMDDANCSMVLSCLRERGIEIPAMIRLASLYDSYQMEHNQPPVTSLRFDTRRLGKNACIELLKMLGENVMEEEPSPDYQVILRESTK